MFTGVRADVLRAWAAISRCARCAKPSAPSSGEAITQRHLDLDRGVRDRDHAGLRIAGGAREPRDAGAGHLRHRGRRVGRHRAWCSSADPQNMVVGARLLRRHQRHQSVPGLGVLELPARDRSRASRPSGCSASSPRAAPPARSSGRSSPTASSTAWASPACCTSARRMFFVAIFCQRALLVEMRAHADLAAAGAPRQPAPRATAASAAIRSPASAVVLKSPYLLGIALFVIMISAANTILYFEQLRLVKDMFDELGAAHADVRAHRFHRAGADRRSRRCSSPDASRRSWASPRCW